MSATQNKAKILVLASTFPRWNEDTEPAFIEFLSLELAKQFDVHVLAPHAPGVKCVEKWKALTVFRFIYCIPYFERLAYNGGMLSNLSKNFFTYILVPPFMVAQLLWILYLVARFRYQAIHAHWLIPQGLLAMIASLLLPKNLKPKIVCTSHGGDLYALNGVIFSMLKKWIIKKADAVTVVSTAMLDYIRKLQIECDNIFVYPMGVDLTTKFLPPSHAKRNDLIYVGRLVEKKGVEYLIKAMEIVCKKHPDIKLTIIGSGPLYITLKQFIEKLNLHSNVKMLGSIPNEQIAPLLQKALISITPSISAKSGDQEGLGLVIVEALGCECAVVASDLPAIHDVIIDNKTGLLAKPGDPNSLAEKIELLLHNRHFSARLARNGRKFVEIRFNWRQVGKNYCSLINDLINTTPHNLDFNKPL